MSPATPALLTRTEHAEQVDVFLWAELHKGRWPELALLFAIPNFAGFAGGKVARLRAGAKAKAEGRKKGVPDICLPVARGGFYGLFIELKRVKGGTVSAEQRAWLAALAEQGYRAVRCRGAAEAIEVLTHYLRVP